ncbi:hypothetical protein [Heyndrickxia camelliae]|uniref:DUF3139 domain-containing protein n=1 Tax=Heyndrickxia camelliae TaxID=1707093 RepID=A0A2N3LKU2_9BACI|nr:hypothetical protein [Heyndrickxia camelliae]PKR85262.1 hypothetical protein CWO92_08680 [Heyndrickxia camelliae]
MSKRESLLGYVALVIAVIFIIGFVLFSQYQNKVIMKQNMSVALKQDKTTLDSYSFSYKRVDYSKSEETWNSNHSSLYKAFYHMLHYNTELGNNKIYEATGTNGEKYEIDLDRKLQVVEWHKK